MIHIFGLTRYLHCTLSLISTEKIARKEHKNGRPFKHSFIRIYEENTRPNFVHGSYKCDCYFSQSYTCFVLHGNFKGAIHHARPTGQRPVGQTKKKMERHFPIKPADQEEPFPPFSFPIHHPPIAITVVLFNRF